MLVRKFNKSCLRLFLFYPLSLSFFSFVSSASYLKNFEEEINGGKKLSLNQTKKYEDREQLEIELNALKNEKKLMQKSLCTTCKKISFLEEKLGYSPTAFSDNYNINTLDQLDTETLKEVLEQQKLIKEIVDLRGGELELIDKKDQVEYERKKRFIELASQVRKQEAEDAKLGEELLIGFAKGLIEIKHQVELHEQKKEIMVNLAKMVEEEQNRERQRRNENCNIF